jgi:CBS domain-containing protein/nitroimidazol reductase NimA-like FMN-containing flavoprotein (pyridoxamine 5'-phosphate oxidase superfamily)
MQASEFMATTVVTVGPDTSISDAGRLLLERDITALPVVGSDGRIVGVVSRSDLIRGRVVPDPRAHLIPVPTDESEPPHTVADVMTTEVVTLPPTADEAEAAKALLDHRVKSAPVVSDGRPVGVVSVTDILRSKVRGDGDVARDVRSRIAEFQAVDDEWSVHVNDGVVTISGTAPPEHRRVALLLAETVPGVVRAYYDDPPEGASPDAAGAGPPATDRRGLVVLGLDECLRRLAFTPVGRLAFVIAGGPVVLPVNHRLDGTNIVFRTTWGSKLQIAQASEDVAFEVDTFDTATRTGWSVLVRGKASTVYEAEDVRRYETLGLRPWAGIETVEDAVWIRVRPEEITGREIARMT